MWMRSFGSEGDGKEVESDGSQIVQYGEGVLATGTRALLTRQRSPDFGLAMLGLAYGKVKNVYGAINFLVLRPAHGVVR